MKYIDADKLIAEIERQIERKRVQYNNTPYGNVIAHYFKGELDAWECIRGKVLNARKEE